jgi:2-succinyl-5-enolpyruvyl-6-hydroxy-3-cyclohexene-1-carboxylate synthase
MTPTTDTYTLLRAFVDELVRCGMRAACTSPGSRNTPLLLTLARQEQLRCYSHVDERCAGFFALGLAKSSGLPVAVTCTSGTAAAELLPAVVEAHEARVPLLLLTADRPPELRENGAGQAIDQLGIFGGAAKWFFDVGVHEATRERLRWMRTLACRAYWSTLDGAPGAVHLNLALREPLILDGELPADDSARANGRAFITSANAAAPPAPANEKLHELVLSAKRGVLVAGRHERQTPLGQAAATFAQAVGWPLLADPLSGARRGPAAVAHYDALLRDEAFAAWARPDLVLRVGDLPVSKPLRGWLAGLDGAKQVAVGDEGAWQDPASVLSHRLDAEPAEALVQLTSAIELSAIDRPATDRDWLASWRSADERASEAILGVLARSGLSEPALAAELGVLLPEDATLFVASSMPVRDIETFWPVRPDPPRALCNRGANGIDGTVSSAFGVAADGRGEVVLLIGDVALAHDLGGLLAARRTGLKLTVVLVDNAGGGIFDFLAVARTPIARAPSDGTDGGSDMDADIYTRHVATPTGLDFSLAAQLFGLEHERVQDVTGFRSALEAAFAREGCSLIEVRGERAANVALHRQIWRAVAEAVNPPAGEAAPAA